MNSLGFPLLVGVAVILLAFYYSQSKFRDKMLCTFIRPNGLKIEKWVPLRSRYVVFDRGRHGIGHYEVDPECITLMWYNRGFNKFFPTLVPTMEFKFDTPNPLNPKTFESTWHTPEARHASWEEHQHIAFARATAIASGKSNKLFTVLIPIIVLAVVVIGLVITYQGMSGIDKRIFELEQQIKLMIR